MFFLFIFFFQQKTAYEMRISDWSSDVCSSDLAMELPRMAFAQLERKSGTVMMPIPQQQRRPCQCARSRRQPQRRTPQQGPHARAGEQGDAGRDQRQAKTVMAESADRKSTRLNSSH